MKNFLFGDKSCTDYLIILSQALLLLSLSMEHYNQPEVGIK